MLDFETLLTDLGPALRFAAVLAGVVVALVLLRRLLEHRFERAARFRVPLIMALATFAALLVVVTFLPIEESLRIQLIKLFGVLLSGALALSSTTFLGNALAGVMLRAVNNFQTGDYVRCGEHHGRVSERGLFHTEIQTEDRDLATLPNLYLVSNPVRVTRPSGTIVRAEVSLGYDVPRGRVDELLRAAATKAGLVDPFVQIVELGDYSVVYRAAGLLEDLEQIISSRSRLRGAVLDELHAAGVEIMSPAYTGVRLVDPAKPVVPAKVRPVTVEPAAKGPEDVVFDKARVAAALLEKKERLAKVDEAIRQVEKELAAAGEEQRASLASKLATLREGRDMLAGEIEEDEASVEESAPEAPPPAGEPGRP